MRPVSTGLGVTFRPEWAPEDLPQVAREVEELGFDSLWVVEDCFFAGGLTLAAVALGATSRLKVGIGLLPTAVRNPAIAAMELAGLARLYPGRLTVVFGHGVESWMRQIDARPRDRVGALAVVVRTVRELLAGRMVATSGEFVNLHDVRLDHPPPVPPELLIGTTGRRGLEVAGQLADGILLPQGATPAAVRWARSITTDHDPASRTVVYAWVMIDDDAARARLTLRPELDRWLAIRRYPELARHLPDGSPSDDWLAEMAIAGGPPDAAAAVVRLTDAGAESVVLRPPIDSGMKHVRRFGEEVVPLLVGQQEL
jgi:alkanesulfonate monooxygenase SsuD/methylene tetrahydromethanopterin reductase-like flavin-dependent oxidoreductase (luciferase family)